MKILIAIDEARCAEQAVKFAAEHNWKDPEFLLVHFITPVFAESPGYSLPVLIEEEFERQESETKVLLDAAAEQLRKATTAPVRTYSQVGFPGSAIADVAKDWHADLIIVGSHGKHGLKRWIFGSVSGEVASHADCSVIILQIAHCEQPVSKAS